jgi:hypothetical protein
MLAMPKTTISGKHPLMAMGGKTIGIDDENFQLDF